MSYLQILILGVIQGLAELLPVSSSAHVIVAEKLMGLDPSAPEMTFLLVMLHTGTMLAVIAYFWPRWKALLLSPDRMTFLKAIAVATSMTGSIGLTLKSTIERLVLGGPGGKGEVEELFRNLPLMAASLLAAGILIILAGKRSPREEAPLSFASAFWIGMIQGFCLPFRGFSRSGATISVGLLQRLPRALAESFSFALAVVLTPPVILLETYRLVKFSAPGAESPLSAAIFVPGLVGMVASLVAGLGALKWLSAWLEHGRWHYFGYYCLAAAAFVLGVHLLG
jgi:undecaprenyl-diphosphatase